MDKVRTLLLGPWLALGLVASAANCGGGTSARGDTSRETTGGSPSPSGGASSGGVPVQSASGGVDGSSVAAGGSKPVAGNAGDASASAGASGGGGAPGGDGGADNCAEPAAPGCFSCCEQRVCPVDFADCDGNPSDCETPFGARDGCTPELVVVPPPSFGTPVVNADGSHFVVGPFVEAIDFDPGATEDVRVPFAGEDAFVSKFSASGAYLWTYTFGKRVYDVNAAPGQGGGVVVAGSFVRGTAPADPQVVYTDPFVARLDADGKVAWQREFRGVSNDSGGTARVATDDEGRVVLAATFGGDIDFGLGAGTDVRHFPDVLQGYLFEFDVDGSMTLSQAIGDDKCYLSARDLSVSREAIAMRPSVGIDCVIDGQRLGSHQRGYEPVVTFTRRGVLRDAWLLGGVQHLSGPLAYDDGSVVVSGMFTDQLRLGDPGTVIATEQERGSDFMLRLSKDSRLDWVKVFPLSGHLGGSIARTPDSGVLGAVFLDGTNNSERYLVSWHADGTAGWTRGLGCSTAPLIVSNGAWFMLKTDEFGACDLEPGFGSVPANGAPYLVAYHF